MDSVASPIRHQTIDASYKPTIVIVPGLRDHVPEHWQTLLEAKLARVACVPRMERDKLSCTAWVAELDRMLASVAGPVVLVAHSAGCMITVHWAERHHRAVRGALLAAPADLESPLPEGYPTQQVLRDNGWLPIPRSPLPFPTIVVASRNDPLAGFDMVEQLAGKWGAELYDAGKVGHLNPASGYGPWHEAVGLIVRLASLRP